MTVSRLTTWFSVICLAAFLLAVNACGSKSPTSTFSSAGNVAPSTSGLDGIIEQYRAYAIAESNELVKSTRAFVEAARAGDTSTAKRLYARTRMSYERIEPIAEALGSLDHDIDARDGDVPEAEWRGFHRIERILWTGQDAASMNQYAQRLLEDVTLLRAKLDRVDITAGGLALGAVELLNEVSSSKITGEEERYSHTDLYDFAANVEGAQKIFNLLTSFVREKDAGLAAHTADQFQKLVVELNRYKRGSEYVLYTELNSAQTKVLAQAVDALADPLAKVASLVGATK